MPCKRVEMIDAQGNVIEEYDSEILASRANYLSKTAVSDRCHGLIKNPFREYEYTFRFKDVRLRP